MSTTSERIDTLVAPHCVRYASFRIADGAGQRRVLEGWISGEEEWEWEGHAVRDTIEPDQFPPGQPDTFMALHQARLEGSCSPEDAARFCRDAASRRPWPGELGPPLGTSAVLLARVEGPAADRAAE